MEEFWMKGPGFWLIVFLGLCGFIFFIGEYGLTVFRRVMDYMLYDDEEEKNNNDKGT